MGIADNLQRVQQRIQAATLAANRPEDSVRLLAASKRTDANGIIETIGLGHTLFGENRAQALRDKYDVVAPLHSEQSGTSSGICKRTR